MPALEYVLLTALPSFTLLSAHAANVATALTGELCHFQRAVTEILAVPDDLVLAPSTSPNCQKLIRRVILVDKLLRQLLHGATDRVDIERDFTGRKAVLERLLSYVSIFTRPGSSVGLCTVHCIPISHAPSPVFPVLPTTTAAAHPVSGRLAPGHHCLRV